MHIFSFHFGALCTQYCVQNNCGSVTPGVLRSLAPPLINIRGFTLGLSYSLTNDDIFTFLNELTQLQDLQLYYYIVCFSDWHLISFAHNILLKANQSPDFASTSTSSAALDRPPPVNHYSQRSLLLLAMVTFGHITLANRELVHY